MRGKRKHARRRTSDYYLVTNRKSGDVVGRLVNISLGGVMILTDGPVAIDQPYELKVALPEDELDRDELQFEARSIWSRHNELADWWESGFEITDLSPEDMDALQALTRRLMARESERLNSDETDRIVTGPALHYIPKS